MKGFRGGIRTPTARSRQRVPVRHKRFGTQGIQGSASVLCALSRDAKTDKAEKEGMPQITRKRKTGKREVTPPFNAL